MKNVFKFLGIAIVACSMFAACGSDWTVKATSSDEAMGTVTGGGDYAAGTECTLTATPTAGYVFVNWSDGSTENPYTFTVTSDVNIVANFAVATGATVGFKAQSWTAAQTNAYYFPSYTEAGVRAMSKDASTYPLADAFYAVSATGTLTDAINETSGEYGDVIDYIEYYESSYLNDGQNTYGDWWAKSANINVKTFDATSLDLYFELTSVMFHASDALDADGHLSGIATAPTANMNMISNTKMTVQSKGDKNAPVINKHWSK